MRFEQLEVLDEVGLVGGLSRSLRI
uniref:Uncharacterized protein n=1 Tax=Arundo donax TaxID=35708 RepID=A0A0A9B3F2_ARUDO